MKVLTPFVDGLDAAEDDMLAATRALVRWAGPLGLRCGLTTAVVMGSAAIIGTLAIGESPAEASSSVSVAYADTLRSGGTLPSSRQRGGQRQLRGRRLSLRRRRSGDPFSIDASGQTTSYAHDAGGELTGITYSGGTTATVTYAYDADGRRTQMVDGTGASSYTWDSLGRLVASPS